MNFSYKKNFIDYTGYRPFSNLTPEIIRNSLIFATDVDTVTFTLGKQDVNNNISIYWEEGVYDSPATPVSGATYSYTYSEPGTHIILVYPQSSDDVYNFRIGIGGLRSPWTDYDTFLDIIQWGHINKFSDISITGTNKKRILATEPISFVGGADIDLDGRWIYAHPAMKQWNTSSVRRLLLDGGSFNPFNNNQDPILHGFNLDVMNDWDTSNVTTISLENNQILNQPIGNWDTSSIGSYPNFEEMFRRAYSFNQDIGSWNTSSAITMERAFNLAGSFDQYIGDWDVSNVTTFKEFMRDAGATSLIYYPGERRGVYTHSLANWDTSSATTFEDMFRNAKFNGDISTWNTSNVTNMIRMFADYSDQGSPFNQDISGWDVTSVTDMTNMFLNNRSFNQPIGNWDISSVTEIGGILAGCESFNQPLNNWDVSNKTRLIAVFQNCHRFNQPLDNWDVSNVTDMSSMFYGATDFNQDITGWDVSNVTDMGAMFYEATSFNQDISIWDTSNVTNMSGMFEYATSFNQDISTWDTSNVVVMTSMFAYATSFNQDISTWDTSSVIDMRFMFRGATSFNQDISNWDVTNVTSLDRTFEGSAFDQDIGDWNVVSIETIIHLHSANFSAANVSNTLLAWADKVPDYNGIRDQGLYVKQSTVDNPTGSIALSRFANKGWPVYYVDEDL